MTSAVLNTALKTVSAPRPKKAFLPPLTALAGAGFTANALPLAALLLRGYAWIGVSLFSGWALGLLIYGVLYGVVSGSFAVPSGAAHAKRRLPANFGGLMIGKLAIFGGAVGVLLGVCHVAALPMLAGLLLTQIGVTVCVMRWLTKNKGTG